MEGREGQNSTQAAAAERYVLQPTRFSSEDILFCIDVDQESKVEMKSNTSSGRAFTRLDSIKQAILMFVHAKLAINPDHRFAFAALGKSARWLRKEFSSDIDSVTAAFRGISVEPSSGHADLSQLLRVANHEAKKSIAQNRILRLILLYCRSSVPPTNQWSGSQKLFTLDVVYLHDKPGPDNCPQKVYDALVETLEQVSEYEGYIFESGQGLTRVVLRHMCVLLSHPQQRCIQDDVDIPKSLAKKSAPAADTAPHEETVPIAIQ